MAKRLKADKRLSKRLVAETFLQPWFVPVEIARSIRRLLPVAHFHKMRFYFDDWGCMRCEKKGVMYGANGMCCRCAQKVQHRVVSSFQKRHGTTPPLTRSPEVCSRVESAKVLLSDLVRHRSSQKSRSKLRAIKF
jgi:hypothetical protein